MSNLNVDNGNDADKNVDLLAKYIHHKKLISLDLNGQINTSVKLPHEYNRNLTDNLPKDKSANQDDNFAEIDKLTLNQLKNDKKFESFLRNNFMATTNAENFAASRFKEINNIQSQFELIEYALKNGQNPMNLFDINLDWMIDKVKKSPMVNLNGRKVQLQNMNNKKGVLCSEFYLKCELVFNLSCLYNGKNLFDLFPAEEIIRQFKECADQFVKFCYNKKCSKEKNGDILGDQLKKEFESIDKKNRRIGGFFGFLCSLILIAIIANIVATFSPWILVIIPLGTLTGYLVGKIKKSNRYIEVLNLLDLENSKNDVLTMQQTFEAFKKEYKSFKQNPPFEKQNETNEKLNNQPSLEESINQSIKGIE